ncbi:MAG: glycoside hydrolase family 16 protein [Chitinophagales bacterium]
MKTTIFLFLLALSTCLKSQHLCDVWYSSYKQVGYNSPPSPIYKPGWQLIFNDEFNDNEVNPEYWNKSTNTDDAYHNCLHGIVFNPNNVTEADGSLKLTLSSDDYAGCAHSGAEIKTFSTDDDSFKEFKFYPDSYIEIRVKNLPFSKGAGSAFWLFVAGGGDAEYREIDIWETYSGHKNVLKSNYHWDYGTPEIAAGESQKIHLYKQMFIEPYNLDYQWVNIGCEWHQNIIKFYLNNSLIRTIEVSGLNSEDMPFDPVDKPMHIRLSMQSPLTCDINEDYVDDSALPKNMYVDYIRVYKQSGTEAVPFIQTPSEFCINSTGENISCAYYPDVNYTWTSTAFDFGPNDDNLPSARWITLKPFVTPNNYYDITVTANFENGYAETHTYSIYIAGNPILPTGVISTVQSAPSSCYFFARIPQTTRSESIYWSENAGLTWTTGDTYLSDGIYYSKYGDFLKNHTFGVKLKTINACGSSIISSTKYFTTPNVITCWLKTDSTSENLNLHDPYLSNNILIYNNEVELYYGKIFIDVLDLTGRDLSHELLSNNYSINLNHLAAGLYISIATNEYGQILNTYKFYKN